MELDRLTRYFIDEALPKWAMSAYDEQRGHFMEALQLDGSAEATGIVRTRTAARLIYVYAHASALNVAPAGALEKAERAFANLHRVAWISGTRPGYARTFDRFSDEVTDPERDLYDSACVLLALAWLAKATGKPVYRRHIKLLIAAIDQTLGDPFGGWAEDSAGTLPRRQNPHMHFLEASLALCETDSDPQYPPLEAKLFALLGDHFFDARKGLLRELFGPRWELSDRYQSDTLEPGHMCEWVWLVRRHEALTGQGDDTLCAALLSKALALGRLEGSAFLLDGATVGGASTAKHRRLWPQTELLKAFLVQHRAHGKEEDLQQAETVAAALFGSYLKDAPAGCWHDRFDLEGNSVAKTIPASSLYHLWTSVVELLPKAEAPSRADGPAAMALSA
ncbi:N-acylglucosamine 2-epimerase [Rhizobium sp. CG5]|uniref:AGE family epimerase/isomerase n=1 Tax=Rhizobium sp. CG5 TaxID=2726076 RepID=UPI002034A4C2|nr:AGE family epimerase/isomerase [Rhizobium sp. CG5]MCM2473175.1 N-acylglucosamine 2-epimerase [Rhizobium sp. CG5]